MATARLFRTTVCRGVSIRHTSRGVLTFCIAGIYYRVLGLESLTLSVVGVRCYSVLAVVATVDAAVRIALRHAANSLITRATDV